METKTSAAKTNKDVSVLERYIQVVPSELLECLNESAKKNGISLEMEVAARLMAYMSEPELASDNALSQKILRLDFTEAEAMAECKRRRNAALYLYEMEKLRLFLRFEHSLPRQIRESFTVIDAKEATKQIKAELKAEEEFNGQNKGE